MYDFCLTLPYGVILAAGGVFGYTASGSTTSLAAGLASGLILILLGSLSLKQYNSTKSVSKVWSLISLVVSSVLSVVMGLRYQETKKIMPAGAIAGLSVAMSLFYILKLASSTPAKKSEKKKY